MMYNFLFVNKPLNCVGDLELTTRRRLDRTHCFIDRLIKQVHTNERKITWWIFWFFNEPHYVTIAVNFGNTKLFWILNMTQQNLCGWSLWSTSSPSILEVVHELCQTLLKHVVTQVHHKVFITQKVVRNEHAVCKTKWRILRDVRDLDTKL